MNVGYFTNQYPKVSHSFIRREILALEKMGLSISRYALQSNRTELIDPLDILEYKKTQYILLSSKLKILKSCFTRFIKNPIYWLKTFLLTNKMGYKSERGLLRHYIYFLEACLLSDWVENDKVEHLHAHFGTNSAAVTLLTSKFTGIPYSFTVHGPEEFDKPNFISLPTKIKHASFVIAISSFGKSQLFRFIDNQYWNKIKVVHCGLEESFYELKNKKNETNIKPHILCIGRLCEQKGQVLLIDALKIVKDRNIDFNIKLIGDGEMRPSIENKIKHYELSNHVTITGWMDSAQIKNEIQNSLFTILPSFAEGLPVVIMESMSLKKPVISTYIAGIPELIENNVNGWLIPAGDINKLADAIEKSLKSDEKSIKEIGINAREKVLERHNIITEARKLRSHFLTSTKPKVK